MITLFNNRLGLLPPPRVQVKGRGGDAGVGRANGAGLRRVCGVAEAYEDVTKASCQADTLFKLSGSVNPIGLLCV